MIFNSIVLGTLLSGMEAEVPRTADVERMQVFILKMMRKALRQRGTRPMEDGSRRILKNEEIMTLFGTYTIESLLKMRRLKWYRTMLKKTGGTRTSTSCTCWTNDICAGRIFT